jgi:hydroxymethylpyrimidine pyrophosphatase-like HAD family hydrolase
MDFKAIIFDLDGTAIPLALEALPSQRVIDAVKKAKQQIAVCAATGRSLPMTRDIFLALDLTDPCIISAGTQIVNPKTEEILWEKRLSKEQVQKVIEIMFPFPYRVGFSDEVDGVAAKEKVVKGSETVVCMWGATEEDAYFLQEQINKIEDVAAHIPGSWTKDRLDIHVTHKKATKKHAIEELGRLLHIEKKDMIGVGDQNNDLPLFESVGFKVAMGNGTEKLKAHADYVTASVDEDGLAVFIEEKLFV